MEIKAQLNYFRVSPRKARAVAQLVVGLPVNTAITQLTFARKRSVPALVKLLKSAIANAKNNFRLDSKNLYVKEFRIDEAPPLKRHMPRAMGRATPIKKRGSHISLVLEETKPKTQEKLKNRRNKKINT
ncbi:MAG: 50S ribosomal protein L22 [Candidatus Tagabacteria bacterium CG_4_10_14_0_2_um_filter_40_13]|uniref:Large ribosomal subunit protein uL22 n=2 Tax=Candidatus Tagaibacteriota TaxID=1817918 RepID=A0A2M7B8J8_9BACT|nr:MAG: 50S ribosomal protein L22 [Candidatus Tagabacteria bacterium CG11_big_fil_rev_8_21_14_0_20_41_11]PIU99445.1 MAG: 50S ribosomal protein L22 [Candidatus Tagabacteria bacterium CG03_land_8_20_14_0_80_41_22]PIZ56372.1 MAG: 50S ribosomal protein L22 [Candidatus Tagabacteria bacterium CG_4_10_14_0_2_um_filter_40_13]PJC25414.1 MAG: 50S ribosomal protein L22 [Candidatus Tagabacteria bacterium CG_4_9_14_0_2_um_filter_41_11]